MAEGENWGGPRKGAGRPPAPYVRLKDVRVKREVWEAITAEAQRLGLSPEDHAAALLEAAAAAPLFRTS